MQYTQKTFTNAGIDLFSKALSSKKAIYMDNVVIDNLPTNSFSNIQLLNLNSFSNAMKYTVNYSNVQDSNLTVDAIISNQGFKDTYNVNEIGLTGHIDGDNNETLLAIMIADEPFYLPPQNNNDTPVHLIPNITIPLNNNDMSKVSVPVADKSYIAQKDLDTLVAKNGYIKLTDADEKYVHQDDYNNDKNNINNSISSLNDSKANNTDLTNLRNNVNDDVKTKLSNKYDKSETYNKSEIDNKYNDLNNSKANNNDLTSLRNNVNDDVKSKLDNTYNKGDVDSKVSNAQNGAIQQSSQYTNQKHDELSQKINDNHKDTLDKNNILSSRLEDYQKPNLVNSPSDWKSLNTHSGNTGVTTIIGNIHFKAGKLYWITGEYDIGSTNGNNLFLNIQYPSWQPYQVANNINGSNTNLNSKIWLRFNEDTYRTIALTMYSNDDNPHYYRKLSITETSDVIPYDVAQSNRERYISNGQFTEDYQAPNLVDGSSENKTISGSTTVELANVHLKANQKYTFSIYFNAEHNNGCWLFLKLPSGDQSIARDIANESAGIKTLQYTPNQDMNVSVRIQDWNEIEATYNSLCITQSDEYVPFEVAQRNKLWNDRITNKTNDLSNRIDDIDKTNYAPLSPCDLNDVTQSGNYLSTGNIKNYKNAPYTHNNWVVFTLTVLNSNGDITQKLNATSSNPQFRMKEYGSWNSWYEIASKTDLQNKTDNLSQQIQNSHTDLNNAKADKYNTYSKSDTDEKINNANNRITNLNNGKADKTTVYSKSDIDNKLNNGVDNAIQQSNQSINDLSKHVDDVSNSKEDKEVRITVNNGDDLSTFNQTGAYSFSNVDIGSLKSTDGLYTTDHTFWGKMIVENKVNFPTQTIYSNNDQNVMYRYLFNTNSVWHKMATDDDIASIKKNSWRELEIGEGFSGQVIAKPNWENKTLKTYGNITCEANYNPAIKSGQIFLINQMNDFDFTYFGVGWPYTRNNKCVGNTVRVGEWDWNDSLKGKTINVDWTASIEPK